MSVERPQARDRAFVLPSNIIKMAKSNYHVVPRGDRWAVVRGGNDRATRIVNTQTEGIKVGREHAINQGTELVIHRPNGRIREGWSYGNDPYPPKG